MNGSGEKRYGAGFEKISKKLRLLYPCVCCGENNYSLKEVHHIDEDKKNSEINNLIVLCKECHSLVHLKKQTFPDVRYEDRSKKIKISINNNWINRNSKVDLIIIDSKTANEYRKQYVKGWVKPGGCNIYLGMIVDGKLRGVLGFNTPDMVTYDLMLKADTTNSNDKYSIDLLLYILRTKKCKDILTKKFNRDIKTVYSMCFSFHIDISRYRKHGNKVKSVKTETGYNIAYLFEIGDIPTIKEAVSQFYQKHKDL